MYKWGLRIDARRRTARPARPLRRPGHGARLGEPPRLPGGPSSSDGTVLEENFRRSEASLNLTLPPALLPPSPRAISSCRLGSHSSARQAARTNLLHVSRNARCARYNQPRFRFDDQLANLFRRQSEQCRGGVVASRRLCAAK